MKKSYWKELCLLLIGFMTGYFIKNPTNVKEHTITNIKDSLVVDTTYVYIKKIPDLNKYNVLAELRKQNIPHSDIVLRQSIHETAHYTSDVCKKYNNIFGIRKGKKYVAYNSRVDCVADYKNKISKRYKGGDYYDFIRILGYAEDPEYVTKLKRIKI